MLHSTTPTSGPRRASSRKRPREPNEARSEGENHDRQATIHRSDRFRRAQRRRLFDFPCDFPIKVMGKSHPEFHDTIVSLLKEVRQGLRRIACRSASVFRRQLHRPHCHRARAESPASRRYLSRAHRPSDGQSSALLHPAACPLPARRTPPAHALA